MFFGVERSCCCGVSENQCKECIYRCTDTQNCSGTQTKTVYVPCDQDCPDVSNIEIECNFGYLCGDPNIQLEPTPYPGCTGCPPPE